MSDRAALSRWFDLECRLLLLGAEERRRPGLRAFRDRTRPGVWDRHLVLAGAPPENPEGDRRALETYYAEGRAEQWSWIGLEGEVAAAWEAALAPLGVVPETLVIMTGAPVKGTVPAEVVALEGGAGFQRLRSLCQSVVGAREGARAAGQVLELLASRAGRGLPASALALVEAGEPVASIGMTRAGDRMWLEDLQTRPDRRRQGLGRRLLHAALAAAHAAGATSVGFSASAEDWPWRWYEREGFRLLGRAVRLRRVR